MENRTVDKPINKDMSCENHKKEILGITDMKQLAEMICDLHYEKLAELFEQIDQKLVKDYHKDNDAGRKQLALCLWDAACEAKSISMYLRRAYEISKPFMTSPSQGKETT